MANTGYKIVPQIVQVFNTGRFISGSKIGGEDHRVDLSVAPFSASLNGQEWFYRSYDPETCEPGYEDCLVPLLTSVNTGSQRGRFNINYVTQSGYNNPLDITASVSTDINFSSSETFSSSIGDGIPVTTSLVSGTVYFRAFTSCSGPTPSPNSDLLSFTYDLLPPPLNPGTVNIIFKNNLSSPMEVLIRSTRGNANYIISPESSITYDYSTSPNPGAWTSTGKSDDLNVTIKGGSKNDYGNFIQRNTVGISEETYTINGGFDSPKSNIDNSSNFTPDKGVSFQIKQLSLPINSTTTTTTFTLINALPPAPAPTPPPEPDPGPGPAPDPTPYVETVFGSSAYNDENSVCANTGVNYREKTYFQRNGYLYNTREDALDNTKAIFAYAKNYILTSLTTYLIVNKEGYIQNRGTCILPTVDIYTLRGSFSDQESACKRTKAEPGSQTFSYKDNKLVNSSLSGRYPIYNGTQQRGGQNIILSAGRIIGYETCGSELTNVDYGSIGFNNAVYPLETPENINPRTLNWVCSNELKQYSLGPSGIVYYHIDSGYPYVPLGLGNRWYKTSDGDYANFDRGVIISRTDPC